MNDASPDQVIWHATLDGKYQVEVTRIDDRSGRLTVRDGERELGYKVVYLAYGAMFGPDIGDVHDWQEIAIGIVEHEAMK